MTEELITQFLTTFFLRGEFVYDYTDNPGNLLECIEDAERDIRYIDHYLFHESIHWTIGSEDLEDLWFSIETDCLARNVPFSALQGMELKHICKAFRHSSKLRISEAARLLVKADAFRRQNE